MPSSSCIRPDRTGSMNDGTITCENVPMATSSNLLDLILSSPDETESLGFIIGRLLHGGEVLALIGDLGVGKTVLVRGMVAGLDMPAESVTSPTFLIVHEYQGRLPIIHIDMYRLQRVEEVESIGLADYLRTDVVVAIEWADRFPQLLPEDRLELKFSHRTRTTRSLRVEARGTSSRSLFARIKSEMHTPPGSIRPSLRAGRRAPSR